MPGISVLLLLKVLVSARSVAVLTSLVWVRGLVAEHRWGIPEHQREGSPSTLARTWSSFHKGWKPELLKWKRGHEIFVFIVVYPQHYDVMSIVLEYMLGLFYLLFFTHTSFTLIIIRLPFFSFNTVKEKHDLDMSLGNLGLLTWAFSLRAWVSRIMEYFGSIFEDQNHNLTVFCFRKLQSVLLPCSPLVTAGQTGGTKGSKRSVQSL